ncbi:MAG: DUF547 domain-containing protein [Candidatus Hodarchaeales archaeon]
MPSSKTLSTNALMKDFIDPSTGRVNYQKLKNDQWLQERVSEFETMDIYDFTDQERFAFWLNAYNIFTLKGALIELTKNPEWKGNLSKWSKIKFFVVRKFIIAHEKMNLRYLENEILRKEFKDPRIHFAINCASASCPYLPDRLFHADTLDDYLEKLTINFINNPLNLKYDKDNKVLKLSMIFKWYSNDFGGDIGLLKFLNKYVQDIPLDIQAIKLEYFKYDWHINSQTELKTGLTLNI